MRFILVTLAFCLYASVANAQSSLSGHIIDKDNLDRSRARLLLIQTARDVLGHAMQLVCVPIIESM